MEVSAKAGLTHWPEDMDKISEAVPIMKENIMRTADTRKEDLYHDVETTT